MSTIPHQPVSLGRAWLLLVVCALAGVVWLAGPAGVAHAAPTEAEVQECVAQNLVRYSTPDRAVIAQYVDIEASCRTALEDEGEAGSTITPVAPDDPGAGSGSAGAGGASGGGAESSSLPKASTPAQGQPDEGSQAPQPSAPADGSDQNGAEPPVASQPEVEVESAPTAAAPSTSAAQIEALLDEPASAGPAPTGLGGLPVGVWIALGAALSAAIGAAVLRGVRRAH